MTCWCSIVPADVLKRFSQDKSLSDAVRKAFADAAEFEAHWRELRMLQMKSQRFALQSFSADTVQLLAAEPAVTVYDCGKGTVLPGSPVPNPGTSAGRTATRVFAETAAVAEFYRTIFGRNSVDNRGGTLQSSVQYGVGYNNAFWNGVQMIYGDGDGAIFADFAQSTDVIAHELTHGVTQYSAQLCYTDDAGGLNESISDVFGSMFRQWRAGQTVADADWLIGHDILGPSAVARGFTCLRDMANPAAEHCMARQPDQYSKIGPGMDPHYTSGVPNRAFYEAAMAIGGKSWETVGQIWYRALTGFAPDPNLGMSAFAARTRRLAQSMFPRDASVYAAVNEAWVNVGL
ncbi:MAG TPA: M4 family metallopeptidase [Steroidobacteraceae bacterium]|nr:M4 family metallopeptidase [Steroidobacteraceae bacterium]